MKRIQASRRLARRSTVLAGIIALGVAGTAHADITGTVVTPGGAPVPDVTVRTTDSDGSFVDSSSTDATGRYVVTTADLAGDTVPFTVTASDFDTCNSAAGQQNAAAGGLADGAVANLTLTVSAFCGSTFSPSGAPEPTGNAWPETGRILSPLAGTTYLRTNLVASGATGIAVTLADGTPVGGAPTSSSDLTVTAPAAPYNGIINLTYTDDGVASTRPLATLIAGSVVKPPPPSGPFDLAAIVDVSGSMSGADPSNRRRDAVNLLIDLAGQGDRLVGTGFDDTYRELFPRTTIAGNATKTALKAAARKGIGNFGGTDYNIGIGQAFASLSAEPLIPTVPKGAIFLTDGAHNGTYDNVHLRFAFNGTTQTWPICVVQLGRSFSATDTARLKRIAAETGGVFRAAPSNTQLEQLYFQCRGQASGATTLLKKSNVFRVGQSRTYTRKVTKGQRSATFFVSWGVGKYRVQLVQPGGKLFKRTAGRVRFVSGRSLAFFQVQAPKVGFWRLKVTRLKTGGRTDTATTTVTVQKRR